MRCPGGAAETPVNSAFRAALTRFRYILNGAGSKEKHNAVVMGHVVDALLLALFLFAAAVPGDALPSTCRSEYQNLPGGLVHTACKPPNPNCAFISTGLSAAEKAEVLKAHNDYRSQVAQGRLPGFPAAIDMYRLKWDNELADVAQAFTNQCGNDHDKEEERMTANFPKVGQNIAWNYESTDTPVVDSAGRVKDWFDEYKDFTPSNADPFRLGFGRVVTHFTQVTWAETRYLGCGYTHYKLHQDPEPSVPFKKLFACNYAPGGNIIGTSMYKKGPVCSACPDGTTCDTANGLCHIPGDSDGLGESGSSTGAATSWAILPFVILGLIAAAVVGTGFLYLRSTTAASAVSS
ncbi:venom allergen 5-like [Dermacentor silvarum]|uniref:venom allergen 5-like n=1 Tax=Dermacentor silvarum TaxID=543639 RepID=UPI002101AF9B|nr:venom allergen 5-like [Dermacentor silvarum]